VAHRAGALLRQPAVRPKAPAAVGVAPDPQTSDLGVTGEQLGDRVGIGLALLLHRKALRLSPLFRVLLILPWAIPNYVTALAWRGLFDEHVGAINQIIAASGGEAVAWWDHGLTAFSANLCTNIWLGFPFMMVIALGALSSIPEPLIEAARIDGASA
jgi:arabinogalactan oligomer/maltooligosaccharide transport system permease protein